MDLNDWLDEVKLVVCVGSGGVGKTTSAAALGLWGAIRGRRHGAYDRSSATSRK